MTKTSMDLIGRYAHTVDDSNLGTSRTASRWHLQLIPTLLHRLPIRPGLLTRLQPPLYIQPLLPISPQLHRHDKIDTELHHGIHGRHFFSAQKLSRREGQLSLQLVEVLLHVYREPFFCLGNDVGRSRRRESAPRVRDREAMHQERAFRRVDPLQNLDALSRIFRKKSILFVVVLAQIPTPLVSICNPLPTHQGGERDGNACSVIAPLSYTTCLPSFSVGNFPAGFWRTL
ncbi:hypothetical protein BU23DRAFT_73120 [Bimuria novae-zelandiae CBS 107.79]|uniref:Uncharacterized protein n=1 Tax=Bimuria novae-zelandiae CBS 107.79 TaxID=1447943 RepID=A0A6A5VD41_9PLEO|nr:hypothetical protein BU23DRAFT_73120 [Bimuria novae-zelandiae CBS 107.79]